MNVPLVNAKFQAAFEPSILLARFVLYKFRILEHVFQMLLDHLEKREDFSDSGNLQLQKILNIRHAAYLENCT